MLPLRLVIVLLLSSFLMGGCWNAREIETMNYINALGVDYVNNKVVVHAQILSFTNIAKMEAGGQQTPETVATVKGEGENFLTAVFQIYPSSQQRLTWSHMRALVFTEEAIRHGLVDQVLDEMDRYYEFRYTLWAYSTHEAMDELFHAKPLFHISVLYSQLTDPGDIFEQNSVNQPIKLYRFISYYKEKNRTLYLPTLALDRSRWTQGNNSTVKLVGNGACIMQNQKLSACWSRKELLAARWVNPDITRTLISVKKNNKLLANTLLTKPQVTIAPIFHGGVPTFTVQVSYTGFISQLGQTGPVEEIAREVEKTIATDIKSLFEKGLKQNIDTLQLGHTLYRKNPQVWKRYAVQDRLPLTPASLESVIVNVSIENGGLAKVKQKRKQK
ncbi:Ger(x)C family spore germination protein [Brevibacillus centrosporus]|uniref:Ger(x)C family spore germination protein n=1 Tax=Brevibacillus centrosporus TaxID=54910 RepID=UPI00398862B8